MSELTEFINLRELIRDPRLCLEDKALLERIVIEEIEEETHGA